MEFNEEAIEFYCDEQLGEIYQQLIAFKMAPEHNG
jgi:hypothetical protein